MERHFVLSDIHAIRVNQERLKVNLNNGIFWMKAVMNAFKTKENSLTEINLFRVYKTKPQSNYMSAGRYSPQ